MPFEISRRSVLRGFGAALSLPLLDMMETAGAAVAKGARASAPPVRAAYLYFPNGVADGGWEPRRVDTDGKLLELNEWMSPLEPLKEHLIVPRNLWTPRGNGHGAGTATWLTGGRYDGKRIDAGGESVDQFAARRLGNQTLLPSLELSVRGEGHFSNDLPRNNISWTTGDRPASRETNPRTVFDRMFRRSDEGLADRSVLDLVREQARRLERRAGREDRRKLEEYFESVRSIERRLDFAEKQGSRVEDPARLGLKRPAAGVPADHGEYMRIMLDMIVLAFWADATRVSTFMLDHGQSNRYFNFVDGVRGTWHALSHYRDASGKTEDDDGKTSWDSVDSKRDMYNEVNRWHHEQIAYFLKRLASIPEGDGTLLDNSMILYGSSLADGHEHAEENLPLLLAGRGGGTIRTGRLLRYREETSLSNVHLAMLQRLGLDVDEFGGSEDPATGLEG